MGYYVTYEGEITFPSHREDEIVAALKALNHRHDLKTGGRSPRTGDPYEDYWFSWLPSRYHEDESLQTVEDILRLLGFETNSWENKPRHSRPSSKDGWTTISVTYDNKIGSEDVFLNEISKFGEVDVYVNGEDGDKWRYLTKNGELLSYNGYVSYDDLAPTRVEQTIQQRGDMWAQFRNSPLDAQTSI